MSVRRRSGGHDFLRVGDRAGLVATFGLNTFVVKYHPQLAEDYPEHVKHATVYGRLINQEYIVNVNMSLHHDATVCVACNTISWCGGERSIVSALLAPIVLCSCV